MQYGYDQAPNSQTAPQQVVVAMNTVESPVKWNWCHVVTAIFGFFCCQPFGLISLVFALLAYTDHKTKDFGRSRGKKNVALGFGIAAIVLGVLIGVIIIGVMAAAASAAVDATNSWRNSNWGN